MQVATLSFLYEGVMLMTQYESLSLMISYTMLVVTLIVLNSNKKN